jgi:hypothetical protein
MRNPLDPVLFIGMLGRRFNWFHRPRVHVPPSLAVRALPRPFHVTPALDPLLAAILHLGATEEPLPEPVSVKPALPCP